MEDKLQALLGKMERRTPDLDKLKRHWEGKSPAAYLSKKSREALDKRLAALGVNLPRLVISSLVDRLQVTGFRRPGEIAMDPLALQLWQQTGMSALAELIHTDRALYGASYLSVWGHRNDSRRPVIRGGNPYNMAVETDGGTGEILSAVRKWRDPSGVHAVLFTPDHAIRYKADNPESAIADSSAWKVTETLDNGLGVVPVVPFIRQTSVMDMDGTSAVADILDLTDALSKIMQDAMVTSEDYARPRRWATGLEIEEDDDGNVIDPFGDSRVMQSEDSETKFGQFDASRLDGYTDLIASLTQQVGALSGLPPHYLGLHGDQPPNAESVRASEAQLTSRAYSEQRNLSDPWGTTAGLMVAVATATDPLDHGFMTSWASPEIRTPAQAADAALKLSTIGVPLRSLLADPLGYAPHEIEAIMQAQRTDQIMSAARLMGRETK